MNNVNHIQRLINFILYLNIMNLIKKISLLYCMMVPLAVQSVLAQKIAFYQHEKASMHSPGSQAFIDDITTKFSTKILTKDDLNKKSSLKGNDILWINTNDTLPFSPSPLPEKAIRNIKSYIADGGNLLLTNQAGMLLSFLDIEPVAPETRKKPCKDEGYGRMLGFHAFREHPLFDGLHGGVYCLKPETDTSVLQTGYFEDELPQYGKVIGVDWDYIFLREEKKMIVEWTYGEGKILMIGGYLLYDLPNRNRMQLERFTANIINYLSGNLISKENYWYYGPYEVKPFSPENYDILWDPPASWDIREADTHLYLSSTSADYWEAAGERMLVMSNHKSGIEEVWAHPFMSLRDLQAGIKVGKERDAVPLEAFEAEIPTTPWGFTRKYTIYGAALKEIVTVSPDDPVMVIHYEYDGQEPAELIFRFTANFRNMWPYSEKVLGSIFHSWNESLNAFVMKDLSGDFVSMLGSNKKPVLTVIGDYVIRDFDEDSVTMAPAGSFQVQGLMKVALQPGECIDLVHAAGNTGLPDCIHDYAEALADPFGTVKNAIGHTNTLTQKALSIQSPSPEFNAGYAWSQMATDRFFVSTPDLGSALVAGYATSDRGWDGAQQVSGRPGYGWYFGRDGQWSGLALLHAGDFEKVRSMLELFIRFQDLDGKIFHELSTSGFVHYDAADATPLFIVLAGRYLHHSGDIEFIRANWAAIEEAIAFCYSTDTDGDLLIENTNVGHGWVEGGNLFGSHTSLYLASCWAAALEEAAYMADAQEISGQATRFRTDAAMVKDIINDRFWNLGRDYYYHGLFKDGSFHEEPTIMPAIPMLFGQTEPSKAQKILPYFASNVFTSDWGCRIVGENSPFYNPNGYHSGSVWPLFTGWAALAEFKYGNYLQGFAHLMNNLLIYNHWGVGYLEEVLNGAVYKPSGVCHHQCWSQTMVQQPAIEGMLGFEPDALRNIISLSPWFPADWDSVAIGNIRVGEHTVAMKVVRYTDRTVYQFKHEGDNTLDVHFSPVFPPGTVVESARINGQSAREPVFDPLSSGWVTARFGFWLKEKAEVVIRHTGGISILPLVPHPEPGETSKGFRIMDTQYHDSIYTVAFQGRRTARETFQLWTAGGVMPKVDNARIISREGNVFTLEVDFPDIETDYVQMMLNFEN